MGTQLTGQHQLPERLLQGHVWLIFDPVRNPDGLQLTENDSGVLVLGKSYTFGWQLILDYRYLGVLGSCLVCGVGWRQVGICL